jgi:hypothetical protein
MDDLQHLVVQEALLQSACHVLDVDDRMNDQLKSLQFLDFAADFYIEHAANSICG